MNEESVEIIRANKRNFLVLNRQRYRDDAVDSNRPVTNLSVNRDTVLTIANKLKTKSHIDVTELQILKNALIEDATHIEIVLNVHGALRGLVREITGREVNKQCAAIGCCCNLALGDARAGVAIVKAAGTYLVAALDSLTTELAVTSAWTLGNLSSSGLRSCELLATQGAITKLIELMNSNNEELKDAALYAVMHITYQMRDNLRSDHLTKICSIIHYLDINILPQFIFTLSCHKNFTSELISKELILKLLQYLILNIHKDDENTTYIFRCLANINSRDVFIVVLSFLCQNNMVSDVKKLAQSNESVLWCLGNALKLCIDHQFIQNMLNL